MLWSETESDKSRLTRQWTKYMPSKNNTAGYDIFFTVPLLFSPTLVHIDVLTKWPVDGSV